MTRAEFLMPGPSLAGVEVADIAAAQGSGDRFWVGFFAGTLFGLFAFALLAPTFS